MREPSDNPSPRRILVIDDRESIHADFEKVLRPAIASESERALDELEKVFFEPKASPKKNHAFQFEIAHALQGEKGLEMAREALAAAAPFSVAFVDMRMPPGWDGLKTVEELSKLDPSIQLVICSAYSDYSWRQIIERVGKTDRLLILKKPFDQAEVSQLASALSEKWLAERQTRLLLNELEAKVATRTKQLTEANKSLAKLNEELKSAVEEARSAERAKGRFLATMSHEIRTTLNGIIGASHMLNHSPSLPSNDREFASIIQTSGDALMTIINDILDYSKYESGQLELESIPFALKDLANECIALMDTSATKHDVNLQLDYDSKLPQIVNGDPSRLRQVTLNLLNNALKFGRGGVVTLRMQAVTLDAERLTLKIEVQDYGIGMSEKTVDRLFSAFMQADSSTTREYGGTGLGLAICKLLADAMSAKIEVESELGEGSTFSFSLDLPHSRESECDNPGGRTGRSVSEQNDSELIVSESNFSQKRILLVDDNAINRKLGSRFLQKLELDVTLASSGHEAIELANSNPFDLILMDLQMPEIDGIEATKRIRASSGLGRDVPIVALTANAFSEVREECLNAGMVDFLTKPLRVAKLAETLHRCIETTPLSASQSKGKDRA